MNRGWQFPRRRETTCRALAIAIELHADGLRPSEAGELESLLEECLDAEVED